MIHQPHPLRVQRSRQCGAKLPEGTICATRPGVLSNPFVGEGAVAAFRYLAHSMCRGGDGSVTVIDDTLDGRLTIAVGQSVRIKGRRSPAVSRVIQRFRVTVHESMASRIAYPGQYRKEFRAAIASARGKHVACWCPLDRECHADVLCEIANS